MSAATNKTSQPAIEVDARGLACPLPVVKAKKALEFLTQGTVLVLVDNAVARDNILKLAASMDLPVAAAAEGADFMLSIIKDGGVAIKQPEESAAELSVSGGSGKNGFLLLSDKLGHPAPELGEALMKSFVYALTESSSLPSFLVLMNGSVRLACQGSDVLGSLKTLAEQQVDIMVCGTCLDYLGLTEELEVGEISNMFSLLELIMAADKVITIA